MDYGSTENIRRREIRWQKKSYRQQEENICIVEESMELKRLEYDLTVCKVAAIMDIDMTTDFFFIGKTDEEISLVCKMDL